MPALPFFELICDLLNISCCKGNREKHQKVLTRTLKDLVAPIDDSEGSMPDTGVKAQRQGFTKLISCFVTHRRGSSEVTSGTKNPRDLEGPETAENDSQEPSKRFFTKERFVTEFTNLWMPGIQNILPALAELIKLSTELCEICENTGAAKSKTKVPLARLGQLLGADPKLFSRLFGIMQGDADDIVQVIAPIIKLNEKRLKKFVVAVQKTIALLGFKDSEQKDTTPNIEEIYKPIWLSLVKKVRSGNAGIPELFQLVDMEGDKSGGISRDEFARLLRKLSMPMSKHKVIEIFSECQRIDSNHLGELDLEGK